MQVLLLTEPVEKRSLFFEQRLPRREEHRAADVQADPFAVAPPGGVDPGAVADALRRRPARLCGGRAATAGGGRRRSVAAPLAVFVVVIVVVVVIVAVAVMVVALVTRHRSVCVR